MLHFKMLSSVFDISRTDERSRLQQTHAKGQFSFFGAAVEGLYAPNLNVGRTHIYSRVRNASIAKYVGVPDMCEASSSNQYLDVRKSYFVRSLRYKGESPFLYASVACMARICRPSGCVCVRALPSLRHVRPMRCCTDLYWLSSHLIRQPPVHVTSRNVRAVLHKPETPLRCEVHISGR